MNIIPNKIIPFVGFLCVNLFGNLFVREEWWNYMDDDRRDVTINHESIHTVQMKELLYIFFYIIYFLEWLVRLVINGKDAYRNISFEKEAYAHEKDFDYLNNRKPFAQWRKSKKKA